MANVVVTCKVNLNGVAEKLRDLEPKISRKLIRDGLKAVGQLWVPEVQSRVPVLEGDVESIHAVVRTRKASDKTPVCLPAACKSDRATGRQGQTANTAFRQRCMECGSNLARRTTPPSILAPDIRCDCFDRD